MTVINFDTAPTAIDVQPARVWTRTSWAGAWVEREDLIPVEAQWKIAPESNTATLVRYYGSVKAPGALTFSTVTPETTRGYFVLIEYPADDPLSSAAWYWLGYAESPIDQGAISTRDSVPASGRQLIPCFGLDALLRQTWIDSTVHVNPATPTELIRSDGAAMFNAPNANGNKSVAKDVLTVDAVDSASAYAFDAGYGLNPWSTLDILEHITAFHLPTVDGIVGGAGRIPFTFTGTNALPTWDAPTVVTEGRSVYDIIDELVTSDRLLSWSIGAIATPGDPPTITSVAIHIETALSSALTIPAFTPMRVNTNVHTVTATTDPLTSIDVIEDDSNTFDQIIIRGPREVGVGTFDVVADLVEDWDAFDETAYNNGADGIVTGWAAKQQYAQREDNDLIRGQFLTNKVFKKFRLAEDWDGTVQSAAGKVFEPIPDGLGGFDPFVPFIGECRFMPRLPLYLEIDYAGAVASVDESDGSALAQSITAMVDPVDSVVRSTERMNRVETGFNAKHPGIPFSVSTSVSVDPYPAIELNVSGAPQHAVADAAFTGNAADVPQSHYGGWDYTTLLVTMAIESPRRAEIRSPATLSGADVYRRKFIDLDWESLRRVYVAADTIVGFDDDLTPKLSAGGVLRDPTDELTALATVFGAFHLNTQKRVQIRTRRRPLDFGVGDMISSITPFGTVDAQVRSIRVSLPLRGEGNPETVIDAATTTFDPMQLFVGIRTTDEPRKPNKRDKVLAKRELRKQQRFIDKKWALNDDFQRAQIIEQW